MNRPAAPLPNGPEICLLNVDLTSINRGVGALTSASIAQLAARVPGARFALAIPRREGGNLCLRLEGRDIAVRVVNHRLSPRSAPRSHLAWVLAAAGLAALLRGRPRRAVIRSCPTLETLDNADLIADIRGGDSFSDLYGLGRLVKWSIPGLAAMLLGKRVHYLPQTYGPFASAVSRRLARFLLRRAGSVLARDRESLALAREMAGHGPDAPAVALCPDVAFTLPPHPACATAADPPLPGGPGRVVGLNVSGLLHNGGYTRDNMFGLGCDYTAAMAAVAAGLLEDPGTRILFVPHEFAPPGHVGCDLDGCRAVLDLAAQRFGRDARQRLHLLAGSYDQHEIKAVIGRCDAFVGARMHACIAALSQGVPAVGVAYSKKFHGVFETVDCADMVVDARRLSTSELTGAVLARLAAPPAREDLLRRAGLAVAAVGEAFTGLARRLEEP